MGEGVCGGVPVLEFGAELAPDPASFGEELAGDPGITSGLGVSVWT